MPETLPIAVLISGGGTTLKNLIDQKVAGKLDVDFRIVVSSKVDARGLAFAHQAKIPTVVVTKSSGMHANEDAAREHSERVFAPIRERGVKLVVMGGYLHHVLIPLDFQNRVINIHPSLIPSFCGKGMYGLKVHQAAIDFGVKISGCTVHFVDDQYDHGPIILQRACNVEQGDTAETLQKRVFRLECEALPSAIQMLATKSPFAPRE